MRYEIVSYFRVELSCHKCYPLLQITEYYDLDVDTSEEAREQVLADQQIRKCPAGHLMKVREVFNAWEMEFRDLNIWEMWQ